MFLPDLSGWGFFASVGRTKKPLPLGRFFCPAPASNPYPAPPNARRKDQPDMVFKKYPRWSRPNTEGACHGHCRSSARHCKYLCRDHDSPIVWQPEGARHRWYFATICDAGGQPMIQQVVALDEELLVSLASQRPPRMVHLISRTSSRRGVPLRGICSRQPRNLEPGCRPCRLPSPFHL